MPDLARCFCLPEFALFLIAIGFFLLAYVLYRVLLYAFRKLARRENFWKRLVQELRFPALLLFLELAAILSFGILTFSEEISEVIHRIINIFIIATFGWFFIGITRALYHNFVDKVGDRMKVDVARRSLLTQVLFLYRFLVFAIFVITIAAILLNFPYIRSVGLGILGSAGIVGIALGIAARPILLNLMAGFQIAITKMIKIGDAVTVEGEFARIESLHLTHVIACTWDWRRIILPISYFIDKPFQNWDTTSPELLGSVMLYCDYTAPVEAIRQKAKELITSHPCWNKKFWNVQVTNCTDKVMEIRILASGHDASAAFELRAYLREELIDFLQKEYPEALPCYRNLQL